MKKSLLFIFLVFSLVCLTSCTFPSNATSAVPTVTLFEMESPNPSPSPITTTKETCDLAAIPLEDWEQALPYSEMSLSAQIYQGQASLMLWYVDPNLSQAALEEIETWATGSAITALKQLSVENSCLFEFESIYVTVVDAGYQLRFSGSIRTADLAQLSTGSLNGETEERGGGRILPVDDDSTSWEQSCQWVQVSNTLAEMLAEQTESSSFSLVREAGVTNITAYLQISATPDDDTLTEFIETLYAGLGCMQSAANGISISITLPDSTLVLTGYQPLNADSGYDLSALSVTRFVRP